MLHICDFRFSLFLLETLKFERQCSQYLALNPTCVFTVKVSCQVLLTGYFQVCKSLHSRKPFVLAMSLNFRMHSRHHCLLIAITKQSTDILEIYSNKDTYKIPLWLACHDNNEIKFLLTVSCHEIDQMECNESDSVILSWFEVSQKCYIMAGRRW